MGEEDEYSSQIEEESDLFFDDAPLDEEDKDLQAQVLNLNQPTSSRSELSDETLRARLAGPSSDKAGLDNVDKEKVNQVIYEISKGTPFFEYERRKDEAITKRINAMLAQYEKIKDLDLSFETRIADAMIRAAEAERDLSQCFCHIDMDAFYAAVEEVENPELKTIPIAIGNSAMLCTSNYVARRYGVRSAMPGYIARKLCPSLQIIRPNFQKYQAASDKVRAVFAKYDPDFVAVSLDEAYLNLTKHLTTTDMTPEQVVQQIRDEIFQETQLTSSAGIAANSMLAKVCSDINKPNGQHFLPIDRDVILSFAKDLRLRKVSGVGRVTERVLEALGVKKCGDVYQQRAVLYKLLSPISFRFMIRRFLGLGSSGFNPEAERKSVGVERTFQAMSDPNQQLEKMKELSEMLASDLAKKNLKGYSVGIKLKLTTFDLRARSKRLPSGIYKADDIARIAKELLLKEMPVELRLMGVRVTSLQTLTDENEGVKKYFTVQTNDPSNILSKRPNDDEIPPVKCPICGQGMQLTNSELNRHLDECLNRDKLQTLLNHEQSAPITPTITDTCSEYPNKKQKFKKSLKDYWENG